MLGIGLLALAHADVSLATLEQWREDLRAPVAATAGRRFVEDPPLRIVTSAALRDRLQRIEALADRLPPSMRDVSRKGIPTGAYLTATQEILFPTDAYRALFGGRRLDVPASRGPDEPIAFRYGYAPALRRDAGGHGRHRGRLGRAGAAAPTGSRRSYRRPRAPGQVGGRRRPGHREADARREGRVEGGGGARLARPPPGAARPGGTRADHPALPAARRSRPSRVVAPSRIAS